MDARLPGPLLSSGVWSNLCPLSWWCYVTISSSAASFSFCLLSFPASGSFPVSQFFISGGQSIGASASASILPMSIWDWFPLGLTGWISSQSKGLSRVFSSTTVSKISSSVLSLIYSHSLEVLFKGDHLYVRHCVMMFSRLWLHDNYCSYKDLSFINPWSGFIRTQITGVESINRYYVCELNYM